MENTNLCHLCVLPRLAISRFESCQPSQPVRSLCRSSQLNAEGPQLRATCVMEVVSGPTEFSRSRPTRAKCLRRARAIFPNSGDACWRLFRCGTGWVWRYSAPAHVRDRISRDGFWSAIIANQLPAYDPPKNERFPQGRYIQLPQCDAVYSSLSAIPHVLHGFLVCHPGRL